MRRESDLTQEELKKWLIYNPDTGKFVWIRRKCGVTLGMEAGAIEAMGYRVIKINGHFYKAHRLAFLFMEGEFPEGLVDHANMEKTDNRWSNLRKTDRTGQYANRLKQRNNSSGYKGVSWKESHRAWCARIQVRGKAVHLGYFKEPQKAHEAYCEAAEKHFGEFAHDGEKISLTDKGR